jgi:hypothetical protein
MHNTHKNSPYNTIYTLLSPSSHTYLSPLNLYSSPSINMQTIITLLSLMIIPSHNILLYEIISQSYYEINVMEISPYDPYYMPSLLNSIYMLIHHYSNSYLYTRNISYIIISPPHSITIITITTNY